MNWLNFKTCVTIMFCNVVCTNSKGCDRNVKENAIWDFCVDQPIDSLTHKLVIMSGHPH